MASTCKRDNNAGNFFTENRLGCVHTNRVESSPIQSIQTHEDAAETLWLTYNGRRGSAYTPTESSRVQSSPFRLTKTQQRPCCLFTMAAAAVRTHQQSRVESNPVQSGSQRRSSDSVAYLQWPPRQCVHTNRVESSRVESHESC